MRLFNDLFIEYNIDLKNRKNIMLVQTIFKYSILNTISVQ